MERNTQPIVVHEHDIFSKEQRDLIKDCVKEFDSLCDKNDGDSENSGSNECRNGSKGGKKEVRYLGISKTRANYYIGTCWLLQEKGVSLTVLPKINNIDYLSLFMDALCIDDKDAARYFSDYYKIKSDTLPIDNKGGNNILSIFLIAHYLYLLERLLKSGLKSGYVIKEENLKSKVRGRVKIIENTRKNTFCARSDRVYCQFQEYTSDTIENRLLKRALVISKHLTQKLTISCHDDYSRFMQRFNRLFSAFNGVSDGVTLSQVRFIKQNKIYRYYNDALNAARDIILHTDNSIDNTSKKSFMVHEFYIDMPRLYEMYVYKKLKDAYGDTIHFQVSGMYGTKVDFIKRDEHIIIDAKYKTRYSMGNNDIIDDIRQLSGYARDLSIRKKLGVNDDWVIPCVLVYPCQEVFLTDSKNNKDVANVSNGVLLKGFDKNKTLIEQCESISGFYKFYKMETALHV